MKTKLLLLSAFLSFAGSELHAQIDAGDSLALVDLYNNTDGPHWKNHTNWLTRNPVSSWFGITTLNNRVVTMYIYDNGLNGTLPASIGNLIELTELSIGYNRISGSLPSSIGNLTKLTFLSVFYNQLSGSLPPSMGNMISLTDIDLNTNFLTGEIPITFQSLRKLTYLFLNGNQLMQAENTRVPLFSIERTCIVKLDDNHFTFNGLESIDNRAPFWISYYNQAPIRIHRQGKQLAVSAGGSLRNNTYYWYKTGSRIATAIAGDSTFTPAESGLYYAKVKNQMAKSLTLFTDTVTYTVPAIKKDWIVSVSPNPARDAISIQVPDDIKQAAVYVADVNGTVRIRTSNYKQPVIKLNIDKLKAGQYLLMVSNGTEMKTVHFIKE